mmetsp:Transcript_13495/g.29732  ORF Transcript_13495/g.29732 Transcript_13495/m.29732 type:complete len:204 (+) Transcript_13495:1077-1688(+)
MPTALPTVACIAADIRNGFQTHLSAEKLGLLSVRLMSDGSSSGIPKAFPWIFHPVQLCSPSGFLACVVGTGLPYYLQMLNAHRRSLQHWPHPLHLCSWLAKAVKLVELAPADNLQGSCTLAAWSHLRRLQQRLTFPTIAKCPLLIVSYRRSEGVGHQLWFLKCLWCIHSPHEAAEERQWRKLSETQAQSMRKWCGVSSFAGAS